LPEEYANGLERGRLWALSRYAYCAERDWLLEGEDGTEERNVAALLNAGAFWDSEVGLEAVPSSTFVDGFSAGVVQALSELKARLS
jgi:hypothetical protein